MAILQLERIALKQHGGIAILTPRECYERLAGRRGGRDVRVVVFAAGGNGHAARFGA